MRGVRAEQARARRLHRPEGAVTSRAAEALRQRSLKAFVASRTHEVGRLYRCLAESRQSAGGTRRKWQCKTIKASIQSSGLLKALHNLLAGRPVQTNSILTSAGRVSVHK